jgi:CubicO group peptidase (beta-lactamase class C family)
MPIRSVFFLLLFAAAALAQKAAAPPDARAKVDAIFARFQRPDSPGCAVAASLDDEPVISRAYGMADLEHDVPLTPETIFEPGSVSKQFTAAAVLLLAGQGKLSLEDSVRKYVPELPAVYAPVTIRHMLNHTAGLRDWGSIGAIAGWPRTTRVYTTALLLDILSRQQSLNYPPGAAYSYSNSGYNLAAIIVSRVAGKSLAQFTNDEIFQPLGMNATSWREDFRKVVKGRAIAYQQTGGVSRQLMPFEDVHGQGGLLTTVGDLLRWNSNFASARVGGREFVNQQTVRGKLTNGQEIAYAAGLNVLTYRGLHEVSHSGTTAAYNGWLGRYPDQKLSVAVLCNTSAANGTLLGHAVAGVFLGNLPAAPSGPKVDAEQAGLYRSTRDHAVVTLAAGADASHYRFEGKRLTVEGNFGDTLYEKVDPWTPSAQDLAAFTGQYTSEEAEVTLSIAIENGKLIANRRPDTGITLNPTYRDAFNAPGLGSVRFLRNPGGQVTELSIGEARVWDLRCRRLP